MNAIISDIKHFAVHDGDGIRTTVFFKGCPLNCLWCHNPEGISFHPQLSYYSSKCIHCGECTAVCPTGAHRLDPSHIHTFDRSRCTGCGACAPACLGNALILYGAHMRVEELLPILQEDREFYDNSGGGVTLSGGECLMQADFCGALLRALKESGIHTAVDTCGYVSRQNIDVVLPYTDVFLYDIKAIDEDVHIRCTGKSNRLILENLRYIDSMGKAIEARIPYVPGYNDTQISQIGAFLKTVRNLTAVKVLPYHNYAGSKYASLDMENTLPERLPTDAELHAARQTLTDFLGNIVK